MNFIVFYVALLICLLLIGLFAASEAALAATNRVRLRHLLRSQNASEETGSGSGAAQLLSSALSSDAQRFIATVTIAANMPLLAASAITLWLALRSYKTTLAAVAACTAVALLTITLFQITPRLLVSQPGALERLWWVRPARAIVALLRPFVGSLMFVGHLLLLPTGLGERRSSGHGKEGESGESLQAEELRDLVESAGVLEDTGRELIESIFTFGDTRVHEVMVPRPDIVALPIETAPDKVLDTFQESGYSRIPLYEGDVDHIIGILHIKDILKHLNTHRLLNGEQLTAEQLNDGNFTSRVLMRPPLFLPESRKIDEALGQMRAQRTHLAIAVDEFGGTAGLVTVEDILEELVGEIIDEHDRKVEDPFVELDPDHALVDAFLHADDLKSEWNLSLPTGEFDTVAGFMIEQLGRQLVAGDVVELPDALLQVHSTRGRRPRQILITRRKGEREQASKSERES